MHHLQAFQAEVLAAGLKKLDEAQVCLNTPQTNSKVVRIPTMVVP